MLHYARLSSLGKFHKVRLYRIDDVRFRLGMWIARLASVVAGVRFRPLS